MKARRWSNMLIGDLVVCAAAAARAAPFAYATDAEGVVSIIDTATNTVAATVPVGGLPGDIAINPAGTRGYVTDFSGGTLTIIDTTTNVVTKTLSGLVRPNQVAVAPLGDRVYITHNDIPGFVSVLDAASYRVIARITVGMLPYGIAISLDGTRAYVANTFDNSEGNPCHIFPSTCILAVSVIDTALNAEVRKIPVGAFLWAIALNPAGTRAYVTSLPLVPHRRSVSVIDTLGLQVIAHAPVDSSPRGLAVHPSGQWVYLAADVGIQVIDANSNEVTATISLPAGLAEGLAVTPDGRRLYAAGFEDQAVYVIDTTTNALVDTVAVGGEPVGIAIGPEIVGVTPTPTAPRPCAGDCDGDLSVSVEELVRAVTIALGTASVQECSAVDTDGNERVTVDELAAAVNSALTLCPAAVSTTKSPTPTETPLGIATATAAPCTPDCTPGQRCRTNFPELPEGRCEPTGICTSPENCSRVCLCIPHPDNTCGDACTPGGRCRGLFNGQLFDGVCTETCGCSVEGTPSP